MNKSKPIIEVEHLSKCYRIGATREPYLSLREELSKKARRASSAVSRVFGNGEGGSSGNETDFWALNDVSFSVQEGEAVGIIGRNGAGKSTLLKILSQITPPTKGKITMRGRVASLLEVGTGFHPELTGRENIYLNGAILGMRREEIKRKFDEIVDFSEVEKFLDTPVKRYSSGMYVRLAFAVAAHLEPEILVVDEVLAVGDAEFQKKCLGKMGEVARGGRTILFVSHNMNAVLALTNQGLFLDEGKLNFSGSSPDAVNRYRKYREDEEKGVPSVRYDKDYIDEIRIRNFTGVCLSGGDLSISLFLKTKKAFNFNMEGWIKDRNEMDLVYFSEGQSSKLVHKFSKGSFEYNATVNLPFLAEGEYSLFFALSDPNKMTYAGVNQPLNFEVKECDPFKTGFGMKWGEKYRGCIFSPSSSFIEVVE